MPQLSRVLPRPRRDAPIDVRRLRLSCRAIATLRLTLQAELLVPWASMF
jgi:hypothetical protein